jgi:hypothetical protein
VSVTLSLDASPSGPASARYLVWMTPGPATGNLSVVVGGRVIGCTVTPAPFQIGYFPRPAYCLRGGYPASLCGGVRELSGPSRAPWSRTRATGFSHPIQLTIQGLVEDAAAAMFHASSTNAVELRVQ